MIKISNLSLSIGETTILQNVNLSLPHYGLVSIVGDSGCGKTSLLNCISGLVKYDGEILFDNDYLNKMSENEMAIFRLKNMGFIFQDFKLFDFISSRENIQFPLDLFSNFSSEIKGRKCDDLLSLVGMSKQDKKTIRKMSGGEKQRIAIARALVNDPKIILADEPTGSLDNANSKLIMEILSKISNNSLILVVTHDREIANQYSDQIIEMKDGKIERIKFNQKREIHNFVPLFKNAHSNKKPNLPFSFLLKHAKFSIKTKKWRTRICNFITSLGLLGIGLSISLSTSISSGLESAYSTIIDESRIVVSSKENEIPKIKALSEELTNNIAIDNKELISGYGVAYKADFESFFKDENKCILFGANENLELSDYSARSINEFVWMSNVTNEIFPKQSGELKNDEIILSLNQFTLNNICFVLKIKRTIESLSEYLKTHEVLGYFSLRNNDWNYEDEFLFRLKGFVIDFDPYIIHSNSMWNKYVFEDCLRFPTNENINEFDYYPWVLKKCFYLNCIKEKERLIKSLNSNKEYYGAVFEIASIDFYPFLYRNKEVKERYRILALMNDHNSIPYFFPELIMESFPNLKDPIYGTDYGYAIYAENMMSGFSRPMYFSSDESLIDQVINLYSSVDIEFAENVELEKGLLVGHFSKTLQNNVIFSVFSGKLLSGVKPNTYEEIAISKAMAMELFGNINCLNKKLCIAFANKETIVGDQKVKREFVRKELSIVGIVDSNRMSIFHEEYWTIGFFQNVIGVSSLGLIPNAISFNCGSYENAEIALQEIQNLFPQYKVFNPQNLIKESVDGITKYLNIVLIVFSITCSIISTILLYLCNLIHANESKKDIGLSCCVGMYKKEANKFIFFHSALLCFISFIMASLELLAVSTISSYEIAKSIGGEFKPNINPLAFIVMLIFSIIISLFSSIFLAHKFDKVNALSLLK